MSKSKLSPLATASRDLFVRLSESADPAKIEAGCHELFTKNTNGLGSVDTRVVDVASDIVRGVLRGAVMTRSSSIEAAARGVSDTGSKGAEGDAERLSISEETCRNVRKSDDASVTDYNSALKGAAPAARMSPEELRSRIASDPDGPGTAPSAHQDLGSAILRDPEDDPAN